jgi:hypothetical protein
MSSFVVLMQQTQDAKLMDSIVATQYHVVGGGLYTVLYHLADIHSATHVRLSSIIPLKSLEWLELGRIPSCVCAQLPIAAYFIPALYIKSCIYFKPLRQDRTCKLCLDFSFCLLLDQQLSPALPSHHPALHDVACVLACSKHASVQSRVFYPLWRGSLVPAAYMTNRWAAIIPGCR